MRPRFSSQPAVSPQRSDAGGESWRASAVCAQIDPVDADLAFFPGEQSQDPSKYDFAVSICRRCPVQAECLADALATEPAGLSSRFGVRGGLTPRQRYRLQRDAREVTA